MLQLYFSSDLHVDAVTERPEVLKVSVSQEKLNTLVVEAVDRILEMVKMMTPQSSMTSADGELRGHVTKYFYLHCLPSDSGGGTGGSDQVGFLCVTGEAGGEPPPPGHAYILSDEVSLCIHSREALGPELTQTLSSVPQSGAVSLLPLQSDANANCE